MNHFAAFALAIACFVLPVKPATAENILAITENGETVELTRDRFDELDTVEINTTTDWTDGVNVFRGPLVRDVLKAAGHNASVIVKLKARAANDYTVEIPASDIQDYDVILATEMDGKQLTLRDKGPLWIVYPRDDHKELRDPVVNARWIWQLVELRVE